MSQLTLNWELFEEKIDSVERYCSSCGRKVIFYDSMVRRHNANGKNIYKYAIYKCEKGHTWNKILNKYLSNKSNSLSDPDSLEQNGYLKDEQYKNEGAPELRIDKFSISEYSEKNIDRIDIFIKNYNYKVRLDKLLSENLTDTSRTQIQQRIKDSQILVNEKKSKAKYFIRDKDKITIFI
ncbi:S4 domain-containing protein [Wukongibacter baidiensis]|uniref:S4 domain-containing protein n=1 Tax=Wukongibacter baidiensis TaxID=1723361 RepID=UPI003D7FC36A